MQADSQIYMKPNLPCIFGSFAINSALIHFYTGGVWPNFFIIPFQECLKHSTFKI